MGVVRTLAGAPQVRGWEDTGSEVAGVGRAIVHGAPWPMGRGQTCPLKDTENH